MVRLPRPSGAPAASDDGTTPDEQGKHRPPRLGRRVLGDLEQAAKAACLRPVTWEIGIERVEPSRRDDTMAHRSEPADGEEHDTAQTGSGGQRADRQRERAAELSDRAAEHVDRRYDATKETYLEERDRRHDRDRDGTADEETGDG
jgi:hypothetical protein